VAGFWPITRLLALCLALMGLGLFGLPLITTAWQVYLYAVIMGMSTGVVALVFFAVWGQLYGRREVGRIQGIAQMLTVLASALGPVVFALGEAVTRSYTPVFQALAPVALVMAVVGWFVPLPRFAEQSASSGPQLEGEGRTGYQLASPEGR
jgi:MFS family permease